MSLLLALAILLRDKRRDDLAEARKLVISWTRPEDGVGHKVRITNASDRPFTEVSVFNLDQWRCDADSPDGPMLPGESRLFTHDGVGSGVLAVRFTDGDGENWVTDLFGLLSGVVTCGDPCGRSVVCGTRRVVD